jgi:tRNA pseudouridine55 synthase
VDGVLLFDKPMLWTSHDAVDFIRARTKQKAVGHAGTLDPLATGLLVILLGKATHFFQSFSLFDKSYAGSMTLGIATDTQDLEGRITAWQEPHEATEEKLREIFFKSCGKFQQVAPSFSAVRRQGKKLYALSRKGKAVDPPSREVEVSEFKLLRFETPEVYFSLVCSKGTYVRSLCDGIGKELGCGATLSSLVRTRVGCFGLDRAFRKEQIEPLSVHKIEECLIRDEFTEGHEGLLRLSR